jgi:hypothetical protein
LKAGTVFEHFESVSVLSENPNKQKPYHYEKSIIAFLVRRPDSNLSKCAENGFNNGEHLF